MGYMKEKKILKFLKDLAKNLRRVDRKYAIEFYDQEVRYGSKRADLVSVFFCSTLEGIAACFQETDCPLKDFRKDPDLEVFIACEGTMYEKVYLHVASGGSEKNKALYDAFTDAAEKHGMYMSFCDGALGFYPSEESEE